MLAGGKLPIIYLMLSGSLLSSSICTMQCRYSVWVESVATFRHCNAVMRYALQQLQSLLELQTDGGSRRFHNNGEGTYSGLLLVESTYYRFHI